MQHLTNFEEAEPNASGNRLAELIIEFKVQRSRSLRWAFGMNKHHLRIFVWGAVILLLFEAIAFGLISRGCKPEWMSRANNVRKLSLGLIAYNADFYSKKLPEGTAQHPKSLSDLIPNQYIMEVDLPQLTQNLESVSIPDPGSIYKPTDVVILATYKKDQIIVYASGDIIHRKK